METIHKLQKMIDDRKWKFLGDITANAALDFLGQHRRPGPPPKVIAPRIVEKVVKMAKENPWYGY